MGTRRPSIRRDVVHRDRLTTLFEADRPALIAVIAPAGFGKTTAVIDWIESSGREAAWLTIDRNVDAVGPLLRGLADAIRPSVDPEGLDGLLSTIHGDEASVLFVDTFVDDVGGAADELVLVVEDVHQLTDRAARAALRNVVERLIGERTIVITSRADPPLPLARLRAQSRLVEIRSDALRFDRAETRALLGAQLEPTIASDIAGRLQRRVDGWPIGLQLAATSLVGHADPAGFVESFTGSDRYIADYLLDEVVDQEDADTQEFLLLTSVLDDFDASLCQHVTGRVGSGDLLEDLRRRNVFIEVSDVSEGRFSYHQLFAELLRARLDRRDPSRAGQVLEAAASWHEREGDIDRAIRYRLRSGALDEAARLAVRHGPRLLMTGDVVRHRSWMDQFPGGFVSTHPGLLLTRAWGALFTVDPAAADRDLERIERIADDAFRTSTAGQIDLIHAIAAWFGGDPERCIAHSRRSLQLLPDSAVALAAVAHLYGGEGELVAGRSGAATDELATAADLGLRSGDIYTAFSAQVALGATSLGTGALHRAAFHFESALDMTASDASGREFAMRGAGLLGLGIVALERFELATATDRFRQALLALRRTPAIDYIALAYRRWAECAALSGEHEEARAVLTEARQHLSGFGASRAQVRGLEACEIRNLVRSGDLDEARRLDLSSRGVPQRGRREFDDVSWEQVAATVDVDLALHITDNSAQRARALVTSAADHTGRRLEALALSAAVHELLGDRSATASLVSALDEAAPEGWLRPFVAAGPLVLELAARVESTEHRGDLLRRLHTIASATSPEPAITQPLVDPLTPREVEVLGEIAAGLTNAQVAEKLYISVGTAKRHVANIFMKLGASHRAEAIALGRKVGILP